MRFVLFIFFLVSCQAKIKNQDLQSPLAATQGAHFQVGGKPFYFAGTNLYNLAMLDGNNDEMSIDQTFSQMRDHHLNVIRIWGFCNGAWPGVSETMQSAPYQISEKAAERVDYVLDSASRNGVKIIFVFVNFEPDYNGMQWYVDSVLGAGKPKELFYTDEKVKAVYKNYVKFFVGRTNTVNGKLYKNDPSIFSWELANEPHTTDNYEKNLQLEPGKIVLEWLNEMSVYVKSLDPNHMVSTGEEGYRTQGDLGARAWLNDGTKGIDFKADVSLPAIDFGTLHFYPDHWGFAYQDRGWILDNFVGDRKRLTDQLGKPLLLEEFGFIPSYGDRDALLQEVFTFGDSRNAAGYLVWRLAPKIFNYETYDFTFSMAGATSTLNEASILASKI